jgi:Holliday junction resolvase RusA-like endonuclease
MRTIVGAREVRFVVPGSATSFRVAGAKEYKRQIAEVARPRFEGAPPIGALEIRLDYFHTTPRRFDMDNLAKAVIDALSGVAYVDDRQVRLQSSRAHDLTGVLALSGIPVDLVKPLRDGHANYLLTRLRYSQR